MIWKKKHVYIFTSKYIFNWKGKGIRSLYPLKTSHLGLDLILFIFRLDYTDCIKEENEDTKCL